MCSPVGRAVACMCSTRALLWFLHVMLFPVILAGACARLSKTTCTHRHDGLIQTHAHKAPTCDREDRSDPQTTSPDSSHMLEPSIRRATQVCVERASPPWCVCVCVLIHMNAATQKL